MVTSDLGANVCEATGVNLGVERLGENGEHIMKEGNHFGGTRRRLY